MNRTRISTGARGVTPAAGTPGDAVGTSTAVTGIIVLELGFRIKIS